MRAFFLLLSLALLGTGVYFKLFYDVPDVQEPVNFFTSWFLMIVGTGAFFMTLFWSSVPPPNRS